MTRLSGLYATGYAGGFGAIAPPGPGGQFGHPRSIEFTRFVNGQAEGVARRHPTLARKPRWCRPLSRMLRSVSFKPRECGREAADRARCRARVVDERSGDAWNGIAVRATHIRTGRA